MARRERTALYVALGMTALAVGLFRTVAEKDRTGVTYLDPSVSAAKTMNR